MGKIVVVVVVVEVVVVVVAVADDLRLASWVQVVSSLPVGSFLQRRQIFSSSTPH